MTCANATTRLFPGSFDRSQGMLIRCRKELRYWTHPQSWRGAEEVRANLKTYIAFVRYWRNQRNRDFRREKV